MKLTASLFAVLLVINSAILFFQYQVYSSALEKKEIAISFDQEIDITIRNGRIFVVHSFENLPTGKIKIQWPITSEKRSCVVDQEASCNRLSEDQLTFLKGENTHQSISYEMPMTSTLKKPFLMTKMFVEIESGNVGKTTVHLTDETKSGGFFATGIPQLGRKSLDIIDYVYFEGKGNVSELYYNPNSIGTVYSSPTMTVYSNQKMSEAEKNEIAAFPTISPEHLVYVHITAVMKDSSAKRIIFLQRTKDQTISSGLIKSAMNALFKFDPKSNFIKDTVTGFIINKPYGAEKSKEMFNVLSKYLSDEQKKEFVKELQSLREKTITPDILDKTISKIIRQKTTYFTLNEKTGKEIVPLLFEEDRKIYVQDVEQPGMRVIYHNDRVLYSTEPLLAGFGYTANAGPNGYYVSNAARVFRFPLDENFYVFNEQRYDVISHPIEKIGDAYYIEETWLIRLFLVEVQKEEKRINIVPATTVEE